MSIGFNQRSSLPGGVVVLLVLTLGCVSPSQRAGESASPTGGAVDEAEAKESAEKAPDSVLIPAPDAGLPTPTTAEEWIGRTAPDFVLLDSKGERHQLSATDSDIVVLEWTSIVCSFVKRHYARVLVQSMSKSYQEKGVTWFSIDSSLYPIAHPIKVEKWIEKRRIPHPVLLDPEGIVGEAFSVKVTPTVVILKGGKVVFHGAYDDDIWGRSADSRKFVIEALDALIAGESVPEATPTPYGTSVPYLSVESVRRAAREAEARKRRAELEQEQKEKVEGESDSE